MKRLVSALGVVVVCSNAFANEEVPCVEGPVDAPADTIGALAEVAGTSPIDRCLERPRPERPTEMDIRDHIEEIQLCLRSVNDDAVPTLKATIARVDPELSQAFGLEKIRTSLYGLCQDLADASDSAHGTMARVYRDDCRKDSEKLIGEWTESVVGFGGELREIRPAVADYPKCYAEFDAAPPATGMMDMRMLAGTLTSCVQETNVTFLGKRMTDNIVRSFPDRTRTAVTARVASSIGASHEAADELCYGLSQAGGEAGGTLALLEASACGRTAAEGIGALIRTYAR